MDISLLIDKNILPVRLKDNIKYVEEQIVKCSVLDLPVVENSQFLGFVSRNCLSNIDGSLSVEHLRDCINPSPFVEVHTHWFDILKEMKRYQFNSLAVLESGKYLGVITGKSLIRALGNSTSIQMPGTIMVLKINTYDYVLSRLAQITEERNVKIMCLNVELEEESASMKLHLKLNTHEIEGIGREFERFGFHILETYQENSAFQEDIMENYDALMKYLNV